METTDNEPRSLQSFADALLMPQKIEEQQDDETPEAPVEDEQTEGETAEAGGAEADDGEAEADDGDPVEQDDDDQGDEGDEQPELITVKVDGVEKRVTLEDLKRSYSGQEYIQKRMQENAAKAKEVEGVYHALAQERAQLAQFVQRLQQDGVPQQPKMPDPALAQKDPATFNRQLGEYMVAKERFEQFQAQSQRIAAQQTAAQERAFQAYVDEQDRILQEHIPEFADADKAREVKTKLVQVGHEYGYSEDELARVTDARAVQVLNDARKWRELQASKGRVAERAAKARPVVKPGAKPQQGERAAREKLRQRLRETGDIQAAADLLIQ